MNRRTRRECRQIPYPQADARKEGRNTTDTTAMRPLLFPDDRQFWYETLRALGPHRLRRADIGEVVTTAARISAGDYDSWYEQWAATAQRTEAEARAQLAVGHQVSARDGLLRAATTSRCPNRCVARSTSARRSSGPVTSTRR